MRSDVAHRSGSAYDAHAGGGGKKPGSAKTGSSKAGAPFTTTFQSPSPSPGTAQLVRGAMHASQSQGSGQSAVVSRSVWVPTSTSARHCDSAQQPQVSNVTGSSNGAPGVATKLSRHVASARTSGHVSGGPASIGPGVGPASLGPIGAH